MKKILIQITDEQYEQLHELKTHIGIPVNESIRRAIDEYMDKRPVKVTITALESSQPEDKNEV